MLKTDVDSQAMLVWQEYYMRVSEMMFYRRTNIIHTIFWILPGVCGSYLKSLSLSVRVQRPGGEALVF